MTFPKPKEEISAATYSGYAGQFARSLTKFTSRYPDARGHHEVLPGLVSELVASKAELTWATIRSYRAALKFALKELMSRQQANPHLVEAITATMEALDRIDSIGCRRRSARTAGKKMKKVPEEDHTAILHELRRRTARSRYAAPTASAVTILRLTGLRPIELRDVQITQGDQATLHLVVRSAKATQGRGLGKTRTLHLSNLTADEFDLVTAWPAHREALLAAAPWGKIQTAVAGYLLDAAKVALGRRRNVYPCLYSYRHQVSADLKSAGLSRSEIAAVMGHKTDLTAGRHYARRVSGSGSAKVRPDQALVARVRQVAKPYLGNKPLQDTPS